MLTTRPELTGSFGMVSSTHWLASGAGMSVLERGGNAADAAVAAGFVLQVVEPHLNGPGGEVPILIWSEPEQRVHTICGQGTSPASATLDRFAALGLDLVPGTGLLPATVPGAFGGWMLLLERWGSWRPREVLEYAVSYAENGWPLLDRAADMIATVAPMFRDEWPTSAQAWLPGGEVPAGGSRMTNRALAATYRRVVAEAEAGGPDRHRQCAAARDAWYRGFVAEAIDGFCAGNEVVDISGRPHAGLLTGDDLAAWQPAVEDPTTFDYRGYTVCKTGPWSQGPVFLQQLALLDGFDLDAMGYQSPDYIHIVVECGKLAFADREAWYGDPAVTDVPLAALLSEAYNEERRRLVGDAASFELRPGSPGGRRPVLATVPSDHARPVPDQKAGVGEPTVARSGLTRGDTCHVDVVDAHGNMISATPSGGWLQSSPTIPELGFCLNTRGQMFWLQPGLPASLAPSTRPRTTLSPSFALRDGAPWLAFGTPGGDQQDQWSVNFFLSLVHGGLNLQAAVEAPMFHSVHMPSSFYPRQGQPGRMLIEDRTDQAVVDALRVRGHDVELSGPWSLGRISAVARDGGWLRAAANPRGAQGYAAGR